MKELQIGATAPDFELPNQDGQVVTLSQLAGQKVLLWFFSRAGGSN
jgi:thioredoxin-dependent peroxiredoxin